MADKEKGKADARYKPWQRRRQGAARTETEAVDDTAGTSSRTSGRTETAGGGGTQQELPLGASSQISGGRCPRNRRPWFLRWCPLLGL